VDASGFSMSEEGTQQVVVEITAIDRRGFRFTGKDRQGRELGFVYRLESRIHRLSPQETTETLLQVLRRDPPVFPLEKNQQVLVTWKVHPKTRERVAVKITLL
jgi:hypothetical protein